MGWRGGGQESTGQDCDEVGPGTPGQVLRLKADSLSPHGTVHLSFLVGGQEEGHLGQGLQHVGQGSPGLAALPLPKAAVRRTTGGPEGEGTCLEPQPSEKGCLGLPWFPSPPVLCLGKQVTRLES